MNKRLSERDDFCDRAYVSLKKKKLVKISCTFTFLSFSDLFLTGDILKKSKEIKELFSTTGFSV